MAAHADTGFDNYFFKDGDFILTLNAKQVIYVGNCAASFGVGNGDKLRLFKALSLLA